MNEYKDYTWYKFDKDDITTWPPLYRIIFCAGISQPGISENDSYGNFHACAHGIIDNEHVLYYQNNVEILEDHQIKQIKHWMLVKKPSVHKGE